MYINTCVDIYIYIHTLLIDPYSVRPPGSEAAGSQRMAGFPLVEAVQVGGLNQATEARPQLLYICM